MRFAFGRHPHAFSFGGKRRHCASFERHKQENSDHEKAYLRLFHGEAVSNIEFETASFVFLYVRLNHRIFQKLLTDLQQNVMI